ncbi:MAG TPA: hypothetical protein VFY65_12855 [Longimicrobium sp.]|nr:hypothetical protein [Longimicrobium sp.]
MEPILKASGVFAAFGYVASRARFNHLGLPSGTSLGVERYLMEAWSLVGGRIPEFTLVALIGACVLACASAVEQHVRRWSQWVVRRRFVTPRRTAIALLFVTSVVAIAFFRTITVTWPGTDIVVGELGTKPIQEAQSPWVFYVGLAAWAWCAAAHRRAWRGERERAGRDPWLRAALAWGLVPLGAFALALPIAFGRSARAGSYPVTEIRPLEAGTGSLCGLLVLETDKELHLWRAAQGRGEVVVLPREKFAAHVGEVRRIVQLARDARRDGSPQPRCEGVEAVAGPTAFP